MQYLYLSSFISLFLSAGISIATPVVANAQTPDAPAASTVHACAPPADYLLGPYDQLSVIVVDLETDFTDKTFTINGSGELTLPHVGRIHAAGLSTSGLETELRTKLAHILKDPQVVVTVSTTRSQPVAILGAVNTPGMRQIEYGKTLFEVLSLAGGLRPDAGYLIHLTRAAACGSLPIPGAQVDPSTHVSSASVKVKDIMNGTNTAQNIPIFPGDTISVPKADLVYAVGSVTKPGGFLLNEHESLSALQVLSLAEGLQKTAASNRAKILRSPEGSARIEIPVNLKLLMAGKASDVSLQPGDILFVPSSTAKSAGYGTLDTIKGSVGAALIYAH